MNGTTQTALIVAVTAAVLGQLLGAALTVFGGWVNDYFASKRAERREERDAARQKEIGEREGRIRKESPGGLRKQELGRDGAFNGIPDGSTTLLAL